MLLWVLRRGLEVAPWRASPYWTPRGCEEVSLPVVVDVDDEPPVEVLRRVDGLSEAVERLFELHGFR